MRADLRRISPAGDLLRNRSPAGEAANWLTKSLDEMHIGDGGEPMTDERTINDADDARVFAALADAMKELGATVQLGQIGRVGKIQAAEIREYQRTWEHPLGLVLKPEA